MHFPASHIGLQEGRFRPKKSSLDHPPQNRSLWFEKKNKLKIFWEKVGTKIFFQFRGNLFLQTGESIGFNFSNHSFFFLKTFSRNRGSLGSLCLICGAGRVELINWPVNWPIQWLRFMVNYINNRRGGWQRHSKADNKKWGMGPSQPYSTLVTWCLICLRNKGLEQGIMGLGGVKNTRIQHWFRTGNTGNLGEVGWPIF